MDYSLLYLTLAFALISFLCSTYTVLRTLLPLLPGHPLNRRNLTKHDGSPSPTPDERPRLKSAQRFTAYLALTDVFAASVLLWEVGAAVMSNSQLGSSRLSDSRVYLATTARPTLLLIVAGLSYVNVVQGRSIALGWADCIVWGPALILYGLGAGLASLANPNSPAVWIGLAAWLSVTCAIVTFCFTRLLVAIVRVRSITRREQAFSPWMREQEKMTDNADLPYRPYSLTFHPNFSGLSTNFVSNIGRSSVGPPQHECVQIGFDNRSLVTPSPFRHSEDAIEEFDMHGEFRSPTPGSHYGLLDRSTPTTPHSQLSRSMSTSKPVHGRSESQGEPARHSIGESVASRASTYLNAGGFIGNSTIRQAIIREAWRDQEPPGTGHAPKVELSEREARGAMVRLGGHLVSAVLGYAFVSPLVFFRLAHPATAVPLVASILLVIGVCQPPIILAYQCWASDGFWFRRPTPPVLTSSSALEFERIEVVPKDGPEARTASRASTARTWKDSMPGIRPDGLDCAQASGGRMSRALSVLTAHPKLQLLKGPPSEDSSSPSASSSAVVKPTVATGHVRLRSLKLSRATLTSLPDLSKRPRAGSSASRKTVAGFEHARNTSTPVSDFDKSIARSLLRTRREQTSSLRSQSPRPPKTPTLDTDLPPLPSPLLFDENALTTHELTLYPSSTTSTPVLPSNEPLPVSIDYLSAQILPQLVPSVRLSRDLRIDAKDEPIPRPPQHLTGLMSSTRSRMSRNSQVLRDIAMSTFSPREGAAEDSKPSEPIHESWIAVEDQSVAKIRNAEEEENEPVSSNLPTEGVRHFERERSASIGTRLDISFEWEAVDATEVLDEGTFADESAAEDDDHKSQSRVRATSTFDPILPLSVTRRPRPPPLATTSLDDSVVLRGSRVIDDEDDLHTSTVHCATVRPISRSSMSSSVELASPVFLRSPRAPTKLNSSVEARNRSSITSEGFRNLLDSSGNSWHAPQSQGSRDSVSSDEQRSTSGRRPLPTPPLRPGHRPLSLLGQRDSNVSSVYTSEEDTDREMQKMNRYRLAKDEEPTSRQNIPLPPIPVTIEEMDEDRTSGAPTPRSKRKISNDKPIVSPVTSKHVVSSSSLPTRTPPKITTRSKLRSHHQRNASSVKINDENVNILDVASGGLPSSPSSSSPTVPRHTSKAVRNMR